ncbi:NAD(P)-dependent oxidoreductase [Auraticoccus cholistanensis]|uniref:NAD(P)-dependent oxidoreductase n=1 Tax=Auraticoccus cholistanensis TaxID=2656650 RepID=UPI001E5AEA9A|nr:NAD(P)-dependent oxidoreductase [Auraticoccus cholistanensis]
MSTSFGLIGLGNVGHDLVTSARASGLQVHGHDIDADARARAREAGAVVHEDPRSLAAAVDVVVLSLPNADVVDAVLLGGGVLESMAGGSVCVDMSTNLPARTLALVELGRRRQVAMVDAPVSYGPEGLVSFVGGTEEDVRRVRTWLDAVTVRAFHMGPPGHGQYVKLVQNTLNGVFMGVIGEVLGFAEHAGVDLARLPEALSWTGARSGMLERVLPAMVERRYGTSGTMALHSKDMGYVLQTAAEIGARVPFTAALREVFEDVLAAGDRRWTQTALVEWYLSDGVAAQPTAEEGGR